MVDSILSIMKMVWNFISTGVPALLDILSTNLNDLPHLEWLDGEFLGLVGNESVFSILFSTSVSVLVVCYVIIPLAKGVVGIFK